METLGYVDHERAEPIRFALEDFRTDLNHKNGYEFAAQSSAGETLAWLDASVIFTVYRSSFPGCATHCPPMKLSYLERTAILPFNLSRA